VTGLSIQATDLASKRLELFREIVPSFNRLAIMANASSPNSALEIGELRSTAPVLGIDFSVFEIRSSEDIAPAFEALKGRNAQALYLPPDPLVFSNRTAINTLALGQRLPTMYAYRDYVQAVGLVSYGPNIPDLFRRAADHVDKILRGAKPADIPVEQPTKFDLVINLTTAKALGLEVPPTLLALVITLLKFSFATAPTLGGFRVASARENGQRPASGSPPGSSGGPPSWGWQPGSLRQTRSLRRRQQAPRDRRRIPHLQMKEREFISAYDQDEDYGPDDDW
jgi:hypothetical protein